MTENDIENILRKPVLSNIEHKGALREKLFKGKIELDMDELDMDELDMVAGGLGTDRQFLEDW